MTVRQTILKTLYPVFMKAGKLFGLKASIKKNKDNIQPNVSFYDLHFTDSNGEKIDFKRFRGKNLLLVNTASNCGYTNQYGDLEKLYQLYKDKLVVIAFPSKDFKEQEKLSDKDITSFCTVNFGVTFLIAKKEVVIKSDEQSEVFAWLSNSQKNGWNNKAPEWNFSKYLLNGAGVLTHYFGPGISPLDSRVTNILS